MMREVLIDVLAAAGITLAFMIGKRIIAVLDTFLRTQKETAAAEGNKTAASAYSLAIMVLDSIAQTTVSRIETTQAAAIRKAVKSGEKEFTELTSLSEDAYQDIVKQMSPVVMKALEACVEDTELLIRNKIEEVLPKVKAEYNALAAENTVSDIFVSEQDHREDAEDIG